MVFRGTETNAKTVLCTRFQSPEGCRFGDRCNFAHGSVEIRPRPDGPPGGPPGPRGQRAADEGVGYGNIRSAPSGQFQSRGPPAWMGGPDRIGGPAQYGAVANGVGHWPSAGGGNSGWAAPQTWSSGGGLVGAGQSFPSSLPMRSVEPGNHGWTQHTAPEGYCYYYNSHTGVSQWERPLELDFPLTRRE